MIDIFCISAGQVDSKKRNAVFSRKHRYLNYGLLSLASELEKHGYTPIVIHGLFDAPDVVLRICEGKGFANTKTPLLLSIPSFFALEWARLFVVVLKEKYPNRQVIVGGRWVVSRNPQWIKSHLGVDLVVSGLVGSNILDIVNSGFSCKVEMTSIKVTRPEEKINYGLLYERDLFQPSIMVSTGCGAGCAFCEEANISLSKLKSPRLVAEEMADFENRSELIEVSPYLESSMFVATKEWAYQLVAEREKLGADCKWRVESRVDKLKAANIPVLAKAGLQIIDLGLESASHSQLIKMRKTGSPKAYLSAAQELIQIAHENGIWVKVNVLLYAGETNKSIDETMGWLSKLENAIKGVSAGPVIIYGLPGSVDEFADEITSLGASLVETAVVGVTNISPSAEIDYEKALDISRMICREYMSAQDYFDLKSFSYFSRNYTYSEFLNDLEEVNANDLSFKV